MLHRDMPYGLARYRGLAEPFSDPRPRGYTSPPRAASSHTKSPSSSHREFEDAPIQSGALPEDVIVLILGYLTVAEIMVFRRCSKWFKHLTQKRQPWLNFLSRPTFPVPASSTSFHALSARALEAQVRRQFELSRKWSPRVRSASPIRISSSRRLAMPNNESLTAISSMNAWVAVASDLGGVYVCAPFREESMGVKWIRILALSGEITKLCVTVWRESEGERVAVLWARRINVQGEPISFQSGVVSALAKDLVEAQTRTQGGILLDSSDFVTSIVLNLRNPSSEIMDIAIGERYCAIVDAAHFIQAFTHRPSGDGSLVSPCGFSFQGPHRSSRKTIALQFLPCDQLLVWSDSFVAVYKPVSRSSTTMESKYWTRVPSTSYFGLLTQYRSSKIPPLNHLSIPLLALGSDGDDVTHFDLRVPSYDLEVSESDDYGLSHRRSIPYMQLLPGSQQFFAMGTINGGHSRLVWIALSNGKLFGIALGRIHTGNSDPATSYQSPLDGTALDLGDYEELIRERSPSGPLFVFHEGEGKLLGGVRGAPDLVMLEY